jgi:hypothetical protein
LAELSRAKKAFVRQLIQGPIDSSNDLFGYFGPTAFGNPERYCFVFTPANNAEGFENWITIRASHVSCHVTTFGAVEYLTAAPKPILIQPHLLSDVAHYVAPM